jgi:hypothetical protein
MVIDYKHPILCDAVDCESCPCRDACRETTKIAEEDAVYEQHRNEEANVSLTALVRRKIRQY